ncbi:MULTISPECIES: phage regulatory CII family protein [unclassified Oleiphilus]|uniref:phage regulatory CII family protein n=1 Tax=unclassified Oleiphilus TaxID=2631174 RepID=UPI0007C3F1B6|nr:MULTISPECIES: phage regulatory CII family protein [unclassified Oleiphilus]KZZ35329.1 hypothetical protein A3757_15930 [Oleiphilus sp. HI0117]KZZ61751.1 hypothetical protein A3761_04000 [Oleiphilus sp. HI0123]
MSFGWEQFEDWYRDFRYDIQNAVNELEIIDENNKKRKKGAALRFLMHGILSSEISAGTLSNKLTPTSETHDLSLSEGWHIINISNDVKALMTLCRHKSILLTPRVNKLNVSEEALIPVFTNMRQELSETQDLIRRSIEEKSSDKGAVSLPTKNALKREVYEDFCAAIAMLAHLEAMMIEHQNSDEEIDNDARFQQLAMNISQWSENLKKDPIQFEDFLEVTGLRRADMNRFGDTSKQGIPAISLKLFLRTIEADKSNTLVEALCRSLDFRVFPLEPKGVDISSKSIIDHFVELEGRQADTLTKLNHALKDKQITQDELNEIAEELREEYGAELALLNMLTEIDA